MIGRRSIDFVYLKNIFGKVWQNVRQQRLTGSGRHICEGVSVCVCVHESVNKSVHVHACTYRVDKL